MKNQSELDEGLWKADRNEIKIYGQTKDELKAKLDSYNDKYADHEPKTSNIKTDSIGRFFVTYSYLVNDKDNKETVWSKIGRGASKTKEVINKGATKAKEVISDVVDHMPRRTTLTAPTAFKLGQVRAKFASEHPDAEFGDDFKKDDGSGWAVKVISAKYRENTKKVSSQDRINNIQKVLNKLSDSKLQDIEALIKQKEK